jgi:hypothetical protein
MFTEIVGMLTHADAPQRGNSPYSSPHPFITLDNTQMKLFFVGATHADQSRVREQIRVTLKTP